MASAQVLKKQEHLAAGRKKLEEFRRKKAAEKAKKATNTSQHDASDGVLHEKQPSETEHTQLTDISGAGISAAVDAGGFELLSVYTESENKESDNIQKSDLIYSSDTIANSSFLANNNDVNSSVFANSLLIESEFKDDATSVEPANAKYKSQDRMENDGVSAKDFSGLGNYQFSALHVPTVQEINSASHHSTYYGSDEHQPNNTEAHEKPLSLGYFGKSVVATNIVPPNSISNFLLDKSGFSDRMASSLAPSSYQDSVHSATNIRTSTLGVGQKSPDMGESKFSGSVAHVGSANNSSPWAESHRYSVLNSDTRSSSDHTVSSPPATGWRSRPSFLDSINISRGPLASPPISVVEKTDSSSSKVYPVDSNASAFPQNSASSSIVSGNGVDLFNHVMENSVEDRHDFYSRKQHEDFAALEQHIEDLTQDKFSLQRALEASRTLAESLAAENSALTDSYNQQGSIVSQLKFDLERLQEEIKAQLVELEAVKIEYANAQLECNAADERAKLLASEVIGLEEKALRLRSNELKLERQLENSQAEISSYRKKMSSLEKDRQELQSTIDALQEEKKLLQSKLRKVSASGKSIDIKKSPTNTKDVSTSTEDLAIDRDADATIEASISENFGATSLEDDAPISRFLHDNRLLSIDGLSSSIPSDQMRMIQNIDTLIAELALEKDQVMQALVAESSQSSKLMELNKELTRKLEAQTQRLELLTAQALANDNIPPRQPDPRTPLETTAYADEGDEVMDRVLVWIMKMFPGGPSKRRTSKLL